MKKALEKFLRQDLSSAFWKQRLQDALKFVYFVKQGILHKYCFQRAAGMAYSSLFAMVPTLVVFLSVLSSVKFFPAEFKNKVEYLIFENFIPETSQRLHEQIANYVSGFRSAAGTIGLIGAIFMIVSVFFLLNSIENTFNSIMDADKKRSVLHKLSAYTFVLVWSPLLFGLAYIVRTDAGINFTVIEKLGIFYHYVLIVGTFTLGYKIIPNKTIATRHAFVGGVFATLLWQVANKSFTHFVSEMVQYDRIYGTLGVIPLFLVWLYMVWVVVLAGMEITYVTRHWERLNAGLRPLREPDAWAIQVLERIGRRYLEGDRFEDDKTLLKHLKLTPLELKNILDVLIDKKIVVPFNEEGPYTLARHPDRIMLWEVVSFFVPSFRALARNGNAAVEYTPLGAKLRSDLAGMTLNGWLAAHSEKKR